MTNFIIRSHEIEGQAYSLHEVILSGGGVVWTSNEYQDWEVAYIVANLLNYHAYGDVIRDSLKTHNPHHVVFWEQKVKHDAWLFVYSSDIRYRLSDELRDVARKVYEKLETT